MENDIFSLWSKSNGLSISCDVGILLIATVGHMLCLRGRDGGAERRVWCTGLRAVWHFDRKCFSKMMFRNLGTEIGVDCCDIWVMLLVLTVVAVVVLCYSEVRTATQK